MVLTLIAAASDNHVIGVNNRLPWHLPDDLKRFRALTRGQAVVMGRKTHESIGRPLPDRLNVVITRNPDYVAQGCRVVGSLHEAVDVAGQGAFVIGGADIYTQALPLADTVELTRVHTVLEGDAFFPVLSAEQWKRVAAQEHPADAQHAFPFTFERWERIR